MEGYLGDTPVDVQSHPRFSQYSPGDWAMLFNEMYGQIQGDHHRAWVLDQMSRILLGTPVEVKQARWENGHTEYRYSTQDPPSDAYLMWVEDMKGKWLEEEGHFEYDYYEGCPP